jgi:hypothetical protein
MTGFIIVGKRLIDKMLEKPKTFEPVPELELVTEEEE